MNIQRDIYVNIYLLFGVGLSWCEWVGRLVGRLVDQLPTMEPMERCKFKFQKETLCCIGKYLRVDRRRIEGEVEDASMCSNTYCNIQYYTTFHIIDRSTFSVSVTLNFAEHARIP